jgi:GNAT superfamily N-acetyltransferase
VSEWTIRRATPADRATIERIAQIGLDTYAEFEPGWTRPRRFDQINERRLSEVMPHPMFFGLMAEAEDQAVGYVTMWQAHTPDEPPVPIPDLAHLSQLFVLPEWWGSGVATELLDAAVAEARSRGFDRIRLFTPRDHTRARRFYEREGWAPTGKQQFGPDLGLQIVEYARSL